MCLFLFTVCTLTDISRDGVKATRQAILAPASPGWLLRTVPAGTSALSGTPDIKASLHRACCTTASAQASVTRLVLDQDEALSTLGSCKVTKTQVRPSVPTRRFKSTRTVRQTRDSSSDSRHSPSTSGKTIIPDRRPKD